MEEYLRSQIPCTTQPCLKKKTEEIGIDFDQFMEQLKDFKNDSEIASELGISEKTASHLREHFERYGLGQYIDHD